MAKVALLIGVSEYEPGLNPLPAAVKDIEALQRVLKDSEMGGFDEVKALPNPDRQAMESEIETLFSGRDKEDLVLLFFSGHGIKDDGGKLYFATRITRKNLKGELIRSTAVPANFVQEIMNNSRARRQTIILDCCFSGAFDPALQAKDDGSVDLQTQLGAEGRVVLTSSSSTQYSFEQQGSDLSIYTRYLVEGIETGAGDRNEDGFVSVLELHEYAVSKVQETAPNMTPKIIVLKDKGFEIVLSKARVTDPKLRYRKAASRYANAGKIRPAGRALLNTLRQQLGLTFEEAAEIETEVLRPYQERLANLQTYQETLIAEAEHEYPLSEEAYKEVNMLQELLGLRDADILPIKQEVEAQFAQKSELYQQNLAQYKQVFTETIQREFPLNQQARQDLENLQKSLRLRDEDITGIEQPLLQQAEIRYQAKLRQEAEQQRQKQEKVEYDDKLRRYEQEFSRAIQAGYPLNQHVLEGLTTFQQQLGLKNEDVARIERLIGEPAESKYREKLRQQEEAEQQRQVELERKRQKADYENKLRRYEQEFAKAIQAGYPLNQHVLEGLKTFQQQLGLKDEDVVRIERTIREPAEAKLLEKRKQQENDIIEADFTINPDDAITHYGLGVALYDQGKLDEAIAAYRKAIQIDSNYVDAHVNLGVALQAQGKLDEAIAAYRKAIQIDPNYVNAHVNLGVALQAQGKLDEAIAAFRKAIQIDPNYVDAHYNLGNTLRVQGKLDEAIAAYRKAIQIDPNYVNAHFNLGITLKAQGKLDEAIAAYRKAIQIDPNYVDAHNNLGDALDDQGKLDEAIVIAAYRQAIQINSNYVDAHNNLGDALDDQGKLDEAIAAFRKAIQIDPNFALTHYGLGVALYDQGKLDEAIAAFRKAIQIDPNYVDAHVTLGVALKAQGKLDEAIAAYRKAIQIHPHYVNAHVNLGVALQAQGKLDEAIVAYRKAIQIDPNFALAHNNLEAALKAQGQKKKFLGLF